MDVVNPAGTEHDAQQVEGAGPHGERHQGIGSHVAEGEKEEQRGQQQYFNAGQQRRQQGKNDDVPQKPGGADGGNVGGLAPKGEEVHARQEDVPDAGQVRKLEGAAGREGEKEQVQHVPDHVRDEQP